jgi:hypothetical protein
LPFHASAVAWRGRVHAFTGPSGAGKSTLAAALGQHGLPLFCRRYPAARPVRSRQAVLCLPGHKRLKLTDQALTLTGAAAQEKVAPMVDKHYAEPVAGTLRAVLPLAQLTFLELGEPVEFAPITGAERLARLNDDHYTAELFAWAQNEGLAARFARIAHIAGRVPMQRLTRPHDPDRFAEVTALVAHQIKQEGQE